MMNSGQQPERSTRRSDVRRFESERQATASTDVLQGSINRLEVRSRIQGRVCNLLGNMSNLMVPLEGEVEAGSTFRVTLFWKIKPGCVVTIGSYSCLENLPC